MKRTRKLRHYGAASGARSPVGKPAKATAEEFVWKQYGPHYGLRVQIHHLLAQNLVRDVLFVAVLQGGAAMSAIDFVVHFGPDSLGEHPKGICGAQYSADTVFTPSTETFFTWKAVFPQDHVCDLCSLILMAGEGT